MLAQIPATVRSKSIWIQNKFPWKLKTHTLLLQKESNYVGFAHCEVFLTWTSYRSWMWIICPFCSIHSRLFILLMSFDLIFLQSSPSDWFLYSAPFFTAFTWCITYYLIPHSLFFFFALGLLQNSTFFLGFIPCFHYYSPGVYTAVPRVAVTYVTPLFPHSKAKRET